MFVSNLDKVTVGFVCFQCARVAGMSVSGYRWRRLGLGSPLTVGQSPSLSHGWVCDFFFKAWVCESVAILVLIWYWFVNFLRVNLFCNYLIKKCQIIKKGQVIVLLTT